MNGPASVWSALGGLLQPALELASRWPGDPERRARAGLVSGEPGGAMWLHASSVGELGAVPPFLGAVNAAGLDDRARVTCHTRTGLAHARGRLHLRADLAPFDARFALRRRLGRTRPSALILFETELWPCMVTEAASTGLPVSWVNARVSAERFPGYRRWKSVLAPALRRVSAVAAQTGDDAMRFCELGAPPNRVAVCGNLKHDRAEPEPLSRSQAGLAADGPVVVFGSLREGEEAPVLEALRRIRESRPEWIAVLAPRHPEENEIVARALDARGIPFERRSRPGGVSRTMLLDTLGELAGFYTLADVAFVGGSLLDFGGHDVMEPARAGAPVLFGPYTSHCRSESEELVRAGAAHVARGADELADAMARWGAVEPERSRAARAAREVARASRGAAGRAVAWLSRWGGLLPARGSGGNLGG